MYSRVYYLNSKVNTKQNQNNKTIPCEQVLSCLVSSCAVSEPDILPVKRFAFKIHLERRPGFDLYLKYVEDAGDALP